MLKLGKFTVDSIDLLTEKECDRIHSVVKELKNIWIQRHPIVPFYTLGAAHYFDIPDNPELPDQYYKMAKKFNPILRSHFGCLYKYLANTLMQKLKAPVSYRENLGLPGFHIFLSHKALEHPKSLTHQQWYNYRYSQPEVVGNAIHCDTSHMLVDWETKKDIDFSKPISFTLAISLPKSGGGMYVWDLQRDETIGITTGELLKLLNSRDKVLYSYKPGNLILHSGQNYHQVAPISDRVANDVRITLQGHGLFHEGKWQLFW